MGVDSPVIWDPTPNEVGARTRTFRRFSNGNLSRTDPEAARVSCIGKYFDKDEDCEIYTINLSRHDTSGDSDIQAHQNHNGARVYSLQLYSQHSITSGGQELCYLGPTGKLFLD